MHKPSNMTAEYDGGEQKRTKASDRFFANKRFYSGQNQLGKKSKGLRYQLIKIKQDEFMKPESPRNGHFF